MVCICIRSRYEVVDRFKISFVQVCLFGASEVSLRDIMRTERSTDEQLLNIIAQAVLRKKPKHAGLSVLLLILTTMHLYI